jgi:hypothetical protein
LSFLQATGSRAEDPQNAQPAPRLADEFRQRNIYASNHNYRITRNLIEYSVIEDGRWKLIYGSREFPLYAGGPNSRFVLFDLASDEFERHNVIQNHQDVARRVMKDLLQWRLSQHPYDAGRLAPTEIDAAQMADLQALGYVGNGAADDLDEPNEPNKPD